LSPDKIVIDAGIVSFRTVNSKPVEAMPLTLTTPEQFPEGTITKSESLVAFTTCATKPLNLTVSSDGFGLKLVPTIWIVSPHLALSGFTLVIVG
jgi:hypothetical protein